MFFGVGVMCVCVCVSTPVSKDTTLALTNFSWDFRDHCTAAGGTWSRDRAGANEDTYLLLVKSTGDVLSTYLQILNSPIVVQPYCCSDFALSLVKV